MLGKRSAKDQKSAQNSLACRSKFLRKNPYFAQIVLPPFESRKLLHMTTTPCKAPFRVFGLGEGAVPPYLDFGPVNGYHYVDHYTFAVITVKVR